LRLTSSRKDGTQGKPVTIRVVRAGDDLYARAFKGRSSPWFRGTQVRHQGHIQAGGVRKDVELLDPEPSVADALDAELRPRYRRGLRPIRERRTGRRGARSIPRAGDDRHEIRTRASLRGAVGAN